MCGIIVTTGLTRAQAEQATRALSHRGPDGEGLWQTGDVCLGHRRLKIIDLSDGARQPMHDATGRYTITYNGEIYNYLELRDALGGEFATASDTEVLLAAYRRWGEACLGRLIGMFAFAVWDAEAETLFAARDRFGVKPLFWHQGGDALVIASEIKALGAAGVALEPDSATWATYLSSGNYDHGAHTFYKNIFSLPAGHVLRWRRGAAPQISRWYDVAGNVAALGIDAREDGAVAEEALALLEHTVKLRFRADVPVGVCLSGGFDSSLLLGLIARAQGRGFGLDTFTFVTSDAAYDETPWVKEMLAGTPHHAHFCPLAADEVPGLAARVQRFQDEPFGGVPTLAMAKVHARAAERGVTVLLDGNGLDEGWGGYEYYARAAEVRFADAPVQGSRAPAVRPECLAPDFAALARPPAFARPFDDALCDLQYRDLVYSKIPRAMRFADRVSMMFSRELREPFLDHRLVELGLRQPARRKIAHGQGKWLLRQIAADIIPKAVGQAPKRPVQTPQREWLAGPLAAWAEEKIEAGLRGLGREWLDAKAVRAAWREYRAAQSDNSFSIWQWISLGLISEGDA